MNRHESVDVGPPVDECPDNVSVADSTSKSTPSFLEMIASARVAIVVMCFFGILACGAIASTISDVSCDNALDDTRGVMDTAVVSCFETSSHSLESTMYEMLSYVSVGVAGNTKSFMDENDKILQDLNTVVTVMRRDENKSTQAWAEQTASMQWQRMKSFISNPALPSTIRGIGIFADGHYASAHDMTSGLWMFVPNPVPLATFSRAYNWSGFFKVYPPSLGSVAEPVTGLPLLTGRPLRDYTFFYLTPMSLMGPRLSRTGYIPDGAVRWSNVQNLGNFLGYMLTQRLVDPAGSVKDLEVVVFMTISHIEAFLQKASAGAKNVKTGSKPRLWVTIASSWLAEAQKARGNADWKDADQTNMLIGASDGNSTTYTYGTDPLSGYPNLALYTPLEDISAGDPIISGISRKIRNARYGGYAGVHNTSKKHVTLTIMRNRTASDGTLITPVEEYEEEHMVGTSRFQRPEGIDWWVSLSLDTESVLREVRVMHKSTQNGIESSKEKVEDTISDERRNTKLIVAACAVVLLLMSLYVTYSVMEPIKRVQNAMRVVATMTLEGSAVAIKPSSRLFEVRQMQVDFIKMVECLKEFRAYVPSALLESHGGSSADGVQSAPAGNVAIMFSDIQGSTALWRRSAADMNVALERHNDVIRSFYTAYEGYEVKTIGDAFMVAFSDPLNALKFALEVQTSFAAQAWPAGLNLPNAGLVIRIGINYGSVIQESNPVTGRVDYRGSTVNMAARTEAKARGGTTCITSDTLAQIKASLVDVSPTPCLLSHGVHDLKGLGKHELFLITPPDQKHRLREDTTDTAPREDDTAPNNQQLLAADLSQSLRSQGSSGQRTSLGESVLAGKGHAAANNKKTMLQLAKSHITVAVCRLVCCLHTPVFRWSTLSPLMIPTARDRGGTLVRQLQPHGQGGPRGLLVHRRCHRHRDRKLHDNHVERIEALLPPQHCGSHLCVAARQAHVVRHADRARQRLFAPRERGDAEEPIQYRVRAPVGDGRLDG